MKRVLGAALIAVLVAAAVVAWRVIFIHPAPDGVLFLSGRIEGDDSSIAVKTPGRIREVRFREGDEVSGGTVIATLDDAQIVDQVRQAEAGLVEAQARVQSAEAQMAVLQQQLRTAGLQAEQARSDAAGRVAQAQGNLAASQTMVAQQRAAGVLAGFNERVYTQLARTGDASEQQRVQATSAAQQQSQALATAQRQAAAASGALSSARATLDNSGIDEATRAAIAQQIVAQQAAIATARAQVVESRAQLAEAQANHSDLSVRAPFSGTVITRAAEPGEVVPAGTAIVTLLNAHAVYLRGFIAEAEIGRIKLGEPARVYLDSNPDRPVDAYVMRIDPVATFTPENTYFQSDRVTQVFGVKLALRSGFGSAKPGMPADGEILVRGAVWPRAGRSE